MSQYNKVVNLISQPPQNRTTLECQELVDWLRGRSKMFTNVKYDIITEIIRHCKFEPKEVDEIIIKQGERGDTLYIALQGEIAIYVNQKESFGSLDNDAINAEILDTVTKAAATSELDRSLLGVQVYAGSSSTFGEVALVEQDCIRTATVVANTHLDLLTIDRDLFNRCLRGVVAEDMKAKSDFVERNPAFQSWPVRHKKQLVISLSTEKASYGDKIIKQGMESDSIFFIASGEVEIQLDAKQYKTQYPRIFTEMETLLPDLISQTKESYVTPHQDRINRLAPHRPQQICLLGENEHLGCMEMILGLDSYLETAVARSTVTLLKLRRQQFERIFKRRYAAGTLDTFRDYLAQRLCLYIYQCPQPSSAFLKFINIRLADADVLKNLRKAMYEMRDGVFGGAAGGGASVQEQKERSEKMVELKKRLHIPSGWEISLPAEDLADIALANLSKRLKVWSLLSQVNGGRPVRIQNHVHVVC